MASELLYFNGVNASRGTYGLQPLSAKQLAAQIRGDTGDEEKLDDPAYLLELQRRYERRLAGQFGLKEGVNENDLSQTGWGVIFPAGSNSAPVREALSELLEWRKSFAGERYRECVNEKGYRPGDDKANFLRRQKAATSGPVVPESFPYYLLIVGSPEEIPFRFQYQLDVQYAVGRIYFDTLSEYAQYARSVVAAEKGDVKLSRRAVFFGVQNQDDVATERSARDLVQPLADEMRAEKRAGGWTIDTVIGEGSNKQRLSRLLGGNETPALLFTASHGVEFDSGDPLQLKHQGAILCQDWPGIREWHGPITPDLYFSSDDVGDDARLLGTIAFCFTCFGAGTPRLDDFPHRKGVRQSIAPQAFVSRLPQRLLGHPKGGALAVIGHVDRAWTFSFSDVRGGLQIETFQSTLRRLMFGGAPIGWALEFFNDRYAELASGLTEDLENARWGATLDDLEMSTKWTEHNDARSYIVLGDPAVRLPLGESTAIGERPTIGQVRLKSGVTSTTTEPVSPATPVGEVAASDVPAAETAPDSPTAPAIPQGVVLAGNLPPDTPVVVVQTAPLSGVGIQGRVGDTEVSFGLFGSGEAGSEALTKLTDSLRQFADRLGATLQKALEDAAHLEVETYVADDLTTVRYHDGDFGGAQLRAVTRMSLDGDTQVLVPRSEGALDEELWKIHVSMVQQAQANRADMIRALGNAAADLFAAITGK